MSVNPVNCSHCGALYMRKDPNTEGPKICNVCETKEQHRAKTLPPLPNPDLVRIQIECNRTLLHEVEEMTQSLGVSYSDYFINMHRAAVERKKPIPEKTQLSCEDVSTILEIDESPKKKGKK